MAEKVASVKVSLNGGTFLGQLKSLGEENEKQAKKVESAWKRVGVAGFGSLKKSVGDMGSAVKSTLTMVAGLGGAVSLAGAVKGALDSRSAFKALAFDVEAASGDTINFASVMKDAQTEATKWGVSTTALAGVFREAQERTKNLDFSKAAMQAAAITARGTGASLETLATIAGALGEKFNVADGDIADGLAVAYSMATKAHVPLEEMDGIIDKIGSSAKALGIEGVGGFERIMGMATLAKEATKGMRPALNATMQLLEQMGDPSHRKKMMVAFGVETKGSNWEKGITDIIKKTGGKRELLVKGFEGEQLKVVQSLGDVFRSTFEETTGTVKDKTKAALDSLRAAIGQAGTSNLNAARVAEEAAKRVQSPSAQMAIAMEKLTAEFTKPELMHGLIRLAKVAPEAANKLAGLLELAFDHPAMAAGIFAGMKLGVPLLQGALTTAGGIMASQMKVAVVEAMLGKGGGVASNVGGAGGVVGKAGFVAAAAMAGVMVGDYASEKIDKNLVNPAQKTRNALTDATMSTELNTTGRFSEKGAKESLDTLRTRLTQAKKEREFSGWDVASLGLRRLGTASDKEIKRAEDTLAQGEAALRTKMAPAAEKAASGMDKFSASLERADKAANKFAQQPGPPSSARGPIQPPPVRPGYAPR